MRPQAGQSAADGELVPGGREWSCECRYCCFLAGVRNYLAHHWARGHAAFAISASRSNVAATGARQDNAADGGDLYSYAPHVDIELVSKRLKERRRFDTAARMLGKGARRFNVAPGVEGCPRCLSASHAGWRLENPLPESADHPHRGAGADLLELARQRRQASVRRCPIRGREDWGIVMRAGMALPRRPAAPHPRPVKLQVPDGTTLVDVSHIQGVERRGACPPLPDPSAAPEARAAADARNAPQNHAVLRSIPKSNRRIQGGMPTGPPGRKGTRHDRRSSSAGRPARASPASESARGSRRTRPVSVLRHKPASRLGAGDATLVRSTATLT